jgi:nucleotidyltransferase substrate binding protein (TIGR01987 family)
MIDPTLLDTRSFAKAVARLGEGLQRYLGDTRDTQIRDGLVQRFEFTYELAHKMLKRYLEAASPSPELIDAMAFQDLVRTGNEQGLLRSDWPRWRTYRLLRGKTSHTYDEAIALEVVAEIPDFLDEARHLLDRLNERIGPAPAEGGA